MPGAVIVLTFSRNKRTPNAKPSKDNELLDRWAFLFKDLGKKRLSNGCEIDGYYIFTRGKLSHRHLPNDDDSKVTILGY